MNQHEEVWIDDREYDLVSVLRSTYWEQILVDVETDKIVSKIARIDIV